jgi:hypothetical protein
MKKYMIAAAMTLSVSAFMTSCSKDYLDLNNPNALVAQTAWQTQADVEKGLTGAYHTLYNSFHD